MNTLLCFLPLRFALRRPGPGFRSLGAAALSCFLILGLFASSAVCAPLRLLTVGNSFADDAAFFLPSLAKAGGKDLHLVKANLGGHSLEQHASYLQAYEKDETDPKGRPYKYRGSQASLQEILSSEPWDVVTIQQVSNLSFKPGTFEPYAGVLVAAVRKLAPTAKVYVHQTWAYREDNPLLEREGLTQETMFARLKEAYAALAARYEAPIIPNGAAFQLARARPEWRFSRADTAFDFSHPEKGALPEESGGLNLGWSIGKDSRTGVLKYSLDAKHANREGRYLAACVFYQSLWGDLAKVAWHPSEISSRLAAKLRECAIEAVAEAKTAPIEASVR